MVFSDIVFLPITTSTEDELGQVTEKEDYSRMVFCEKKSSPQSEFFQAGQSGIKASCVLIIHCLDYQDEVTVKFNNKIYHIYRTYERKDETIELYCEVKIGG
nr:phage head closure protein [Bacillus massiliigorillae]